MRNRTADLLLTMETLYRLSYRGQPGKNVTGPRPGFSNRLGVAGRARHGRNRPGPDHRGTGPGRPPRQRNGQRQDIACKGPPSPAMTQRARPGLCDPEQDRLAGSALGWVAAPTPERTCPHHKDRPPGAASRARCHSPPSSPSPYSSRQQRSAGPQGSRSGSAAAVSPARRPRRARRLRAAQGGTARQERVGAVTGPSPIPSSSPGQWPTPRTPRTVSRPPDSGFGFQRKRWSSAAMTPLVPT